MAHTCNNKHIPLSPHCFMHVDRGVIHAFLASAAASPAASCRKSPAESLTSFVATAALALRDLRWAPPEGELAPQPEEGASPPGVPVGVSCAPLLMQGMEEDEGCWAVGSETQRQVGPQHQALVGRHPTRRLTNNGKWGVERLIPCWTTSLTAKETRQASGSSALETQP